jgi:inhibitor of KinA
MNIQPFSERALLVNFEQRIAPEVNDQVVQLARALEESGIPGLQYLIPAYCSLTVGYAPEMTDYDTLSAQIERLQETAQKEEARTPCRVEIPVSYADEYALDKEAVIQRTGLPWEEVIRLHTSQVYRVYMLGFLPGFPYLGKLPEALYCPRRARPRRRVPGLSVGLAGWQSGIYPFEAPGGWQVIGRAAIPVFDAAREEMFLLRAGDEVVFRERGEVEGRVGAW